VVNGSLRGAKEQRSFKPQAAGSIPAGRTCSTEAEAQPFSWKRLRRAHGRRASGVNVPFTVSSIVPPCFNCPVREGDECYGQRCGDQHRHGVPMARTTTLAMGRSCGYLHPLSSCEEHRVRFIGSCVDIPRKT
jgi:hypothetical protein